MVNGGRQPLTHCLPGELVMQYSKMKHPYSRYMTCPFFLSSFWEIPEKNPLSIWLLYHCYRQEINTNYSDWIYTKHSLLCICELTQDGLSLGLFPQLCPASLSHLHWPGSLPQSEPHSTIGKYFNANWCRSCDTESCKDAVAVVTDMWLWFRICHPEQVCCK